MTAMQDFDGLPTAAEWERLHKSREAIEQSACPTCEVGKGERCRTPGRKVMTVPHATRREAAMADGNWSPA